MNKGTIKALLITAGGVLLAGALTKNIPQLRRYVG